MDERTQDSDDEARSELEVKEGVGGEQMKGGGMTGKARQER